MALCLAESLVESNGFDPIDQLSRYVEWYKKGHFSVKGYCFDIGTTVRGALDRFERTGEPWCGPVEANTAGNGSIMRLAPIPLFFCNRPLEALERAGESSRTTHGAETAVDACRYLAALIIGAIHGASRYELLGPRYTPVPGYWEEHPLTAEIDRIALGSFREKNPPAIRGSGYVVESLEAALWAFQRSQSFEHGCLLAVNLGNDADTTGAVYGQIAGGFYGESGIPQHWRDRVAGRDWIDPLLDRLYAAATTP
jgi:ADP-ribosylglycohydrolase